MSAEYRAFINKFADLVTGINHAVSPIADRCLAHYLIDQETYEKVLQKGDTTQDKTRLVLTNITSRIKFKRERFYDFVRVLKEVCEEIAKDLEDELEDVKNRAKISQPDEDGLQNAQPMRQKEKINATQSTTAPTSLAGRKSALTSPQGKPHTPYNIPMKLRQRVIRKHLPQMKSAVEHLILPIAEKSRTKHIISREVYKKATNTKQSEEKRAHSLLYSVCLSVRKDGAKFDAFIEILNCHSSCKELVKNIKQALEDIKAEHISQSQQSLHHRKDDKVHSTQEQRTTEETDSTLIATASSTDDCKYTMLLGGKTTNSKVYVCNNETSELEKQRMREQIFKLKEEVKKKDKEINILKQEREDFQLTLDTLKIRYAKLEKQSEAMSEKLKKITDHHSKQIAKLEKEKKDLQEELGQYRKKSLEIEAALKENQTTLKHDHEIFKETLKKTQADLSNVVRQQNQEACSCRIIIAVCIVAVIIIVGLCCYKLIA